MPIGTRNVNRYYVPEYGPYRSDEYPFEVIMTISENQLTRIFLTPPVPYNPNSAEVYTEPSNIYVMRLIQLHKIKFNLKEEKLGEGRIWRNS